MRTDLTKPAAATPVLPPSASIPAVPPRALLPILLELLVAHRAACRQERPFARLLLLVLGHVCAFGRHTLTQLLVALGLGDTDWSGFYRLFSVPRVDYDRLSATLLAETLVELPEDAPYVVAVDGVQVPRHSRRMPGTSWLKHPQTPAFRPGIHRAQRLVDLAWLTPPEPDTGYSRAIPLRIEPAFPAKAVHPPGSAARTEWQAALAAVTWLRDELDAAGQAQRPMLVIGDGLYSNAALWSALPSGVTLLARCPKNRALYALPQPAQGRGRPRKYGERQPRPDAWLAQETGWQRTTLVARGRTIPVTYRVEGPVVVQGASEQPLLLIVVRGIAKRDARHRRREPAFWLVSAVPDGRGGWTLPWPAQELLGWAWQRWEIEVSHREAKTSCGVGETQCWSATGSLLALQWQWWVYGLLLLTGYRAWGLGPSPLRPLGRWWQGARRWSYGALWQGLREELWALGDLSPGSSQSMAQPGGKSAQWAALVTAARAARRG